MRNQRTYPIRAQITIAPIAVSRMDLTSTQKLARSCSGREINSRNRGVLPLLAVEVDADAEADVDAVAAVVAVAVVVGVEAGATPARTPTNSGRRGTRIVVRKPRSLATAVAKPELSGLNARSVTPARRTTPLRSLRSERLIIKPLMTRI